MTPVFRAVALCGVLAIAVPSSAADPAAGTLDDAHRSVSYTGGPYVVPNQTARATGEAAPICEEGTETCDVYVLTVALSDELRGSEDNRFPTVEITVGWDLDNADFDVYVYAPDGTLVDYAYTSSNPEQMYLPLEDLPNGEYRIVVIPWNPAAQTFTADIAVTGLAEPKGLAVLAGGAGLPCLLALGAFALARRRR